MSVNATGTYRAVVVNNNDPLYQQRVTLNVPQILGNAESNWALPSSPTSFIPKPGQVVWASFDGGDVNAPIYNPVGLTEIKATLDSFPDPTSLSVALQLVTQANAVADGNVNIFYQSSPPAAEGDGDYWLRTTDDHLFQWNAATSNWDAVVNYGVVGAIVKANTAQATADGKIVAYYDAASPWEAGATGHDSDVGDLWYDTSDGNHPYYWDGTQWADLRDSSIATLKSMQDDLIDSVTSTASNVDDLSAQTNQMSADFADYQSTIDSTLTNLQAGFDVLSGIGEAGVEEDYFWVGDTPTAGSPVKLVQISAFVQAALGAGDGASLAALLGLVSGLAMGDVAYTNTTPPMTTFYNVFTANGLPAQPWNA